VAIAAPRFGLICLLSRNAGPLEVIPGAYQIEPAHAGEISQALIRLWENEYLRKEISSNLTKQAAQYSWEQIADQWVENYDSLLK